MSIYSTGNWLSENFYEFDAMDMAYLTVPKEYSGKKLTYIPTTGTNSCLPGFRMTWKDYADIVDAGDKIHICVTIDYSGFDTSNTDGVFNIFFQGANIRKSDGTYYWSSNSATVALNNQKSLKNLVLSSASGNYTYDTTFVVLQDSLLDFIGCNVGFRADYSNGTGMISMSDILIVPEKYYLPPPPKKKPTGRRSISCRQRVYRNLIIQEVIK